MRGLVSRRRNGVRFVPQYDKISGRSEVNSKVRVISDTKLARCQTAMCLPLFLPLLIHAPQPPYRLTCQANLDHFPPLAFRKVFLLYAVPIHFQSYHNEPNSIEVFTIVNMFLLSFYQVYGSSFQQ